MQNALENFLRLWAHSPQLRPPHTSRLEPVSPNPIAHYETPRLRLTLVGPASLSPFSLRRATQEELQRGASPAAETPPLQRRPSVRAVISTAEPSADRGRPQVEPIPETGEVGRPGPARTTTSNATPTSPDLGPRGPELAGLQAERDVVSMRERHQLGKGFPGQSSQIGGEGRDSGTWHLQVLSSGVGLSSRSVASVLGYRTTPCSSYGRGLT